MELLYAIILGIVQGLGEFLPISSSGHVVIIGALFEQLSGGQLPDLLLTNIVLHLGTLAAVFVVYWSRIWRLLGEDRRAIGLLIVGTLPLVIFGVLVKSTAESMLESPLLAGCCLLVTAGLLLWAARFESGETGYVEMSYWQALLIGTFQAFALLPGISRSGATIASGLFVGLRRDAAATFSFLLAIPAILGAATLSTVDLVRSSEPRLSISLLMLGAFVSFAVGLIALLWLLRWLQQGRLRHFAYWCLPVGCLVIVWQLIAG